MSYVDTIIHARDRWSRKRQIQPSLLLLGRREYAQLLHALYENLDERVKISDANTLRIGRCKLIAVSQDTFFTFARS